MANCSMDDMKVLSETDLFLTMSKSFSIRNDSSSDHEEDYSWRYHTKTYFNNSKQLNSSKSTSSIKENFYKNLPGTIPISMNQILTAQNTNAPWLLNVLKKKFHRSRKDKRERNLSKETDSNKTMTNTSMPLAEEVLEKPLNHDGISGKWIINEKEIIFPLIKNFDLFPVGQYNASRAMSSSTSTTTPTTIDDSLHIRHYQYDFQTSDSASTLSAALLTDQQPHLSSMIIEETEQKLSNEVDSPVDFASIASVVKTYYTTSRQQLEFLQTEEITMPVNSSLSPALLPSIVEPIHENLHFAPSNSPIQTTSKRAKSTSAARSRRRRSVGSTFIKQGKKRSESTKKKKSKYYQEHLLTTEEIELREALRIIDLDNIGFFSPSELRKVFKELGINSNDITKIERCLPLDDDGHYSIDNLIKLFLNRK